MRPGKAHVKIQGINRAAPARVAALLGALLLGVAAAAVARPQPGYTVGVGLGRGTLAGDYVQQDAGTVFEIGMDIDTPRTYFAFKGGAETKNAFANSRLLLAWGNPWFKAGFGFVGFRSAVPTDGRLLATGLALDTARKTDLSVTAFPLYLRLVPYASDSFAATIDGYYSLATRGHMDIPVQVYGLPAEVQTNPKPMGGAFGASVSLLWRLPNTHRMALRLSYAYDRVQMKRHLSSYNGDVLNLLGTAQTPNAVLHTNRVLLELVALVP